MLSPRARCLQQDVFFEGVVHNVAEEAGEEHEAEDEDDTTRAHAAQIPVPVESPAGMASPTPLAWEYPVEVRTVKCEVPLVLLPRWGDGLVRTRVGMR